MADGILTIKNISIEPDSVHLYVPPIVWKGDSIGHIGVFDVFFLVLEGECFLNIGGQSQIVRKGQLAFLPKNKLRQYTQTSKNFSMYEIRFDALADGENLMQTLGLTDGDYVVDLPDDSARELFEKCSREEFTQNPIYRISFCANLLSIIKTYADNRRHQKSENKAFFNSVLDYMSQNLKSNITLNTLAELVYMHPTYFVKVFKDTFGIPPLAYFSRMKIHSAMGLLSSSDMSVEEIAHAVGFSDPSYFARAFKKYTEVTPTEYRNAFKNSWR